MTGPPNRRCLLRTSALTLVGLAGCVGSLDGDTAEDSPARSTTSETTTHGTTTSELSESETTTTTTTEEGAIDLAPQSVKSSYLYLTTPDSMDVGAVEGKQFLFVTVAGRGDWPRPGAIELVADSEQFQPTTSPGPIRNPYYLYDHGHVYDPDDEREGWLAFEVPDPLDAESVALAYDDQRWSLPEEFRTALASPPAEFELLSFDAPEQVAPDEFFDISFAVRNIGEGDGTFRACLNESGPSYVPHPVELSVPAGERAEWSRSFGGRVYENTESATYRFRSAVADRDRDVEVA